MTMPAGLLSNFQPRLQGQMRQERLTPAEKMAELRAAMSGGIPREAGYALPGGGLLEAYDLAKEGKYGRAALAAGMGLLDIPTRGGAGALLGAMGRIRDVGDAASNPVVQRILARLPEIEKAGGATLTPEGLDFGAKKGYQIGVGGGIKPVKKATPEVIAKALAKVKPGQQMGVWRHKNEWYFEPSEYEMDFNRAVQRAVDTDEKAIWDYGQGDNILMLRHHSPVPNLKVLKTSKAGTGPLKGEERLRANKAPKSIHYYAPHSNSEAPLGRYPDYYAPIEERRILQLGKPREEWDPEIIKLLSPAIDREGQISINEMERILKGENLLYRSDYRTLDDPNKLKIIKGFRDQKVWRRTPDPNDRGLFGW